MSNKAPIILAVDTPDIELAQKWIETTSDFIAGYKLGLEFFLAFGSEGVRKLQRSSDAFLFLDLKLHDIPNTVSHAISQVKSLTPRFLTVHASGGRAMIAAAVEQAPDIEITAVTVLTSLTPEALSEVGFKKDPLESAVTLALLAQHAGARAIVCSPLETHAIRAAVGPEISIITPGIRRAHQAGADDQNRTMGPKQAVQAGATYLVIGRPITGAWSQGAKAMRDAADEIAQEVS